MDIHYICSAFKTAYQIEDLDFIEFERSLVLFSKEKRMIFEFHCQPDKADVKKCIDAWLYQRVFVQRMQKHSEHTQEVKEIVRKITH